MIKRTLFISTPYKLSLKNNQMLLGSKDTDNIYSVPIEDIGFLILEDPRIIVTMPLIAALNSQNVAVLFCDQKRMPTSMLLNLEGNNIQNETFRAQVASTVPLNKRLWKLTIEQKIKNQALHLKKQSLPYEQLVNHSQKVMSDDSTNREGIAARIYWNTLMGDTFIRNREIENSNTLFNYGYIILRAAVARALVGSGLLPTLGIHHHNRYNAYCLADDIMEPYRPYVDELVYAITQEKGIDHTITKEDKVTLLGVLTCDVQIGKQKRPLMNALSQTTASLAKCYNKELNKITYPTFK